MQLLYLIDSLAAGGAERSLAALAPAYRARGIELEVAFLRDRPGVQDELEAAGARLTSLAGSGGRGSWMRRSIALARDRRPDLVHTTLFESDVVGRIAARAAGVPVVSSLVAMKYGPEQLANPRVTPWKVRATQLLDAATAHLAVRLHAVSTSVADAMAPRLKMPRARIDVVLRGRDPVVLGTRTPERRSRARARLGLGGDDRVVLAVGRQDQQKGLDIAVEALHSLRRQFPDVRLLVAGREGNETARLQQTVRRLGLDGAVRLLGERDDVADLLCAADVYVLSSRREGMPGAMLEAMALETPMVVTDLPAVREVVDDGSAVLVPADAPEALSRGLGVVLAQPDEGRRRAAAARARFLDRFTIDRVADAMVAFYDRALAARR